jgi:predicted nucleotidyltransferase
VCDDIVRTFHPQKVILFGSYAYGTATADSDVDLLVLMPFRGHPAHKVLEIRRAIRAPFPMDLLVRTPANVKARIELGDYFLREIVEEGRTLYQRGGESPDSPQCEMSDSGHPETDASANKTDTAGCVPTRDCR